MTVPMAAAGTILHGKQTFVIRFALPIKLFQLLITALAKNLHGNRPASAKSGDDTPSDLMPTGVI